MMLKTDRLGLPLLAAAQAQKEVTHNEALAQLDALVQPVVVAVAPPDVPAAPMPGQAWIVGSAPVGAWAGQAHALATWTSGGWRFAPPFDGMTIWSLADATSWRRESAAWSKGVVTGTSLVLNGVPVLGARGAAIAEPAGGPLVDEQARTAISAIISALRGHGLIST